MDIYEDEVARRWWALSLGSVLPLNNASAYQLIFAGNPGGPMGPDVCDAVLQDVTFQHLLPERGMREGRLTKRYVGDVEFHVYSSDWVAHRHDTDVRYNHVMLHVVLICDDPKPTRRQDGTKVPVCSLYDLPSVSDHQKAVWACHYVLSQLSDAERSRVLRHAGLLRFEQKVYAFVEQLHHISNCDTRSTRNLYDRCLVPALAEGLGYGRDRDFFRAAGLYLLGNTGNVPEPLGRSPLPSPLDAERLRILSLLVEQWGLMGVWQTLRKLLLSSSPTNITGLLQAVRGIFCELGLSLARTDILVCNVVLPFAVAVALLEHDDTLARQAQKLYLEHPGLSSNRITRAMCRQLLLKEEPRESCQQQGLHYIYQQTCREKLCEVCLIGKFDI